MLLQLGKKLLRLNKGILPERIGAIHRCVSLDVRDVCYKSENIPLVWGRGWGNF